MTTWNYGTDAAHKFADWSGLALVDAVFRSDGTSDDILMDTVDLGLTGVAAYYRFGSKQNALDQTANGNDLTMSGAILGDYGYDFDGADDYGTHADAASLDLTNNWCLEAWMKADSVGENSLGRIISKANAEYSLFLKTAGTFSAVAGNTTRDSAGSSYSLSVWQHLAVSHVAADLVDFWNLGVAKGTAASTNAAAGTNALYVGNNAAGDRTFDGILDEVRISAAGQYTTAFVSYRFPASSTLTGVIDGTVSQDWTNISHTRTVTGDYEGSISQLRYRAGATNPPTGGWTTVANPAVSETIEVSGRYLQVEFTLAPKSDTNRTETPRLLTLAVTGTDSEPPAGGFNRNLFDGLFGLPRLIHAAA